MCVFEAACDLALLLFDSLEFFSGPRCTGGPGPCYLQVFSSTWASVGIDDHDDFTYWPPLVTLPERELCESP